MRKTGSRVETPFAFGNTRKSFYDDVRRMERVIRESNGITDGSKQVRGKVLGRFATKMRVKPDDRVKKGVFGLIGITDLLLPEESVRYGAQKALGLQGRMATEKRIAIALWMARLHNSASNVYERPDWLEEFEAGFGQINPKSLETVHSRFIQNRLEMFGRMFSGTDDENRARMFFNPEYESLVRRAYGLANHPDHLYIAERTVGKILQKVKLESSAYRSSSRQFKQADQRIKKFNNDQAFMQKLEMYKAELEELDRVRKRKQEMEIRNPSLAWVDHKELWPEIEFTKKPKR